MVVKALTHIFTLGYLPSPVFANLLPHAGVMPSREDDFGIVLLRLGTACLEATQFSGMRNEVIGVNERQGAWVELGPDNGQVVIPRGVARGGFGTEIDNIRVPGVSEARNERIWWTEWRAFWQTLRSLLIGWAWTALMSTKAGRRTVDSARRSWDHRWWYGPRQWRFWRREAWREPPHFLHQRTIRIMEAYRNRQRQLNEAARAANGPSTAFSSAVAVRQATPDPAPLPWKQFLLGQEVIEDDEDDWDDASSSTSSNSLAASLDGEDGLISDLLQDHDQETSEDSQAVLLAHITNRSTPLTRRRYAALLAGPSSGIVAAPSLEMIIQERRHMATRRDRDEWDDDRRQSCVVCTIEPRNTILWPCRCLAMCNECRENLAARLAAKDHLCP